MKKFNIKYCGNKSLFEENEIKTTEIEPLFVGKYLILHHSLLIPYEDDTVEFNKDLCSVTGINCVGAYFNFKNTKKNLTIFKRILAKIETYLKVANTATKELYETDTIEYRKRYNKYNELSKKYLIPSIEDMESRVVNMVKLENLLEDITVEGEFLI
jgi:hypothetical protein